MPRTPLTALTALLLLAAAGVRADDEAARVAIAERAREFSAAYVAGDVDALLDVYTDDAVIAPGNSEFLAGREALRAYWTPRPGRRITHHEITPVAIEIVGDTAYDHGHYQLAGVDATEEGERAWGPAHGKYLVVWKRGADGRWRMAVDMWNSRPVPEPAAGQ